MTSASSRWKQRQQRVVVVVVVIPRQLVRVLVWWRHPLHLRPLWKTVARVWPWRRWVRRYLLEVGAPTCIGIPSGLAPAVALPRPLAPQENKAAPQQPRDRKKPPPTLRKPTYARIAVTATAQREAPRGCCASPLQLSPEELVKIAQARLEELQGKSADKGWGKRRASCTAKEPPWLRTPGEIVKKSITCGGRIFRAGLQVTRRGSFARWARRAAPPPPPPT